LLRPLVLLFVHEGGRSASAPHSVGIYSHALDPTLLSRLSSLPLHPRRNPLHDPNGVRAAVDDVLVAGDAAGNV